MECPMREESGGVGKKEFGVYFEDVEVGEEMPELVKEITTVSMVMYAASTWDFHRYHHDMEYAEWEGDEGAVPGRAADGRVPGTACHGLGGHRGDVKAAFVQVR